MEKTDFPLVPPSFSFGRVMRIGMAGSISSALVLFILITISAAVSKNRWIPEFIVYAVMLGVIYGFPTAVARFRSTYWPRRFGHQSIRSALVCVLAPGALCLSMGLAIRRVEAAELPYLFGVALGGPLFFYFLNIGSSLGEDKAARYVESMSDQTVLTEFALYGSSKARMGAIGKLVDQELLARIARTNQEEEVQRQAISRIQNSDLLVELVIRAGRTGMLLNFPYPQVALGVVDKLDDRTVLERISREAKDETVRKAVDRKLTL